MDQQPNQLEDIILKLGRHPKLMHQVLFGHRHPNDTPPFHWEIIDLWHSAAPRVLIKAFRGAAKSTIAEEAIIVQACLRQFKNGIILGETYERAVERLRAIKHEFETNEIIEEMFGRLVGPTWSEGKIILSNGVIIQAFGRGQSLRGSKHLDYRPDRAFGDDIENEESVGTEEAIEKCMRWVMSVVMPALDPSAKIRINGTPLHPRSVLEQLSHDPSWQVKTFPIEYLNDEGELTATWPGRFNLEWTAATRDDYRRLGLSTNFEQEFMCKAEDQASKPFHASMMKVEPTVRTWQAVYAMYDPARSVKSSSASTGVAIWSWVANRLVIWDAYAGMWMPDQIINDIFKVDNDYRPIVVGVEETGLNEFLMQPLRQEQLRRGYAVPIRALKGPRGADGKVEGKIPFIRGLQPFFKAGEVTFAKPCEEAVAQLLAVPTGRIDIPNALAYALRLRPGAVIFDGFGTQHIAERLVRQVRQPTFLAVNATQMCTTGVLVQMVDGGLHVLADWVREGDPGAGLDTIVREAGVEAEGKVRVFAGPDHFSQYDTVGLRAAARKIPCDVGRSGAQHVGREELRGVFRRLTKGIPAFQVSTQARWTLNALAGGYAKEVTREGMLTEFAVEGPYRTLMEGLESFAALMKSSSLSDDVPVKYATAPDGRRFISALATGR